MNAIAKRQTTMLSPPVPDVIPPKFAEAMRTVWSLGPHTAEVKARAAAYLEQLEPYAVPVNERLMQAWTIPIAAAVTYPKSPEETAAWSAALWITVHGLPAGVFTVETQRDLLRGLRREWPSTGEVYAVVAPVAGKIWDDIAALKRVIAAPTKPEAA